ncbi:small ribosomal subunit protein mS35 [Hoplias malabaricus]|uniref:small ribosomal subunit protein mS35 n=1 Tax=Hoplias malabaricus TaxID=27720 RepID=UPI0034620E41
MSPLCPRSFALTRRCRNRLYRGDHEKICAGFVTNAASATPAPLSMAASTLFPALLPFSRVNCKLNGIYTLIALNRRAEYSTGLSINHGADKRGLPERPRPFQRRQRRAVEPRTERMALDQDWTAVYPTAASFKPNAVPLPVRMGYPVKRGVPPEKKGNLELIKIPNFLHLTPHAIKKHCEALKPFCTGWPAALDSDDNCEKHFPIQVQSKDYVSAGPSLRNPKARIIILTVKLSSLNLDDHARKKMIKLSGERYNKDTDILTITTDSCPVKRQNYDYAMYLLTVLYHESWKTEAWEEEKTRADMEEYIWEGSPSQKNVLETLLRMYSLGEKQQDEEGGVREELLGRAEVQEYRDSITKLKNEGETESNMQLYKEAVKKLLNI